MTKITLETRLAEIVRRVVVYAHPVKIILFGSASRGDLHPNSDVDLLVIVPTGTPRRRTAQMLYQHFIGIGLAADIVVVTEEDVERFRNNVGLIIRPALEEGTILYAA